MKPSHIICALLMCVAAPLLHASDLHAGDAAPTLKVRKWLQGTPVPSLEKGKVYVFEFWATWCGPCFQAMPHLSELSKEYEGRATFTGVDVWENRENGNSDAVALVTRFLAKNPGSMSYNVCVDDNDFMADHWLKAAGQDGIPCSFIIGKDGKIAWIGHPLYIQPVLEKVVAGTFDLATYNAEEKAKRDAEAAADAPNRALIKPVDDALKAKDYAKVLDLTAVIERSHPELTMRVVYAKYQALIGSKDDVAIQALFKTSLAAPKPTPTISILVVLTVDAQGLQNDTYRLAAKCLDEYANAPNSSVINCLYYSARASLKGQDYDTAIATAKRTVDRATKDNLLESQIKTYRDFLKECEDAKASRG